MKDNKNAIAGSNIETLFENSITDRPYVIDKIKSAFGIETPFINALSLGLEGKKADVKMSFAGGKTIDVNIKSYKATGFNQCTRSPIDIFVKKFNLTTEYTKELKEFFIKKAKNTNNFLIDLNKQESWKKILDPISKDIVKWSISSYPHREVLVLFDRKNNKMQIFKMTDILNKINYNISYTKKGNIKIGECFRLQRKGGDGNIKTYEKTCLKHPSNHIQIKMVIKNLLKNLHPIINYNI